MQNGLVNDCYAIINLFCANSTSISLIMDRFVHREHLQDGLLREYDRIDVFPRRRLHRKAVVLPEQEQDRQRIGGFDVFHLDHFPRGSGHLSFDASCEQDDQPVRRFVLQNEDFALFEPVFADVQFAEYVFDLFEGDVPE